LERTGLLELIGRENIFLATHEFGMAANQAYESAKNWLDTVEQQEKLIRKEYTDDKNAGPDN
jgi:hypothetical protein